MFKRFSLSVMLCVIPAASQTRPVAPPSSEGEASGGNLLQELMGFESLSEKQRIALFNRVIKSRERFLDSDQAKQAPETCYKFFRVEEYRKMSGNPIVGYFWVDEGFRWPASVNVVQYEGIFGVNEAREIKPAAYNLAMNIAANHMRLRLGSSPIKVKGCCVSMVRTNNPKEAQGVIIEMQIATPGGSIFYRLGVGKKTVGDSIGATIEAILNFARAYEDGSLPRPAETGSNG